MGLPGALRILSKQSVPCVRTVGLVLQGGCDATCWVQVRGWVVPLSWTSEEHNATAEQLGLINNFGDTKNYTRVQVRAGARCAHTAAFGESP